MKMLVKSGFVRGAKTWYSTIFKQQQSSV